MRRKLLAGFLVAVLAIGCLTACGSKDTTTADDSGNSTEGDAGTSESGEDKIVLTYWGWDSNFYEPAFEAFSKEHPNVEFEVTAVASSDYATKLQQSITAGTELPDILASEINYRGQMLAIDVWEDLTQAPYNLTEDMFFESSINITKNPDGKIVCVDETVSPAAFGYKRDLALQYLGTDDPDELAALCPDIDAICELGQKVQKDSNGKVFLFPSIGGIMEWLRGTNPVTLINENGEVDFTAKYKTTIENAAKLRDANAVDVLEQWSPQENAAYAGSNHIFFPAANWSLAYSIKPNDPDGSGNWGLFAPGGTGFSWGGTALGINKDSKNKEMAWEFIKFCTMEDAGIQAMKENTDYYTPYKAPYEDPGYTSHVDEYFGGQDIGDFLYNKILPQLSTAAATEYDGVAFEVVVLEVNNLIADRSITAEQALADALVEMQNRLPDEKIV